MGIHVEWLGAPDCPVEILQPDQEAPDGQFTDEANLGLMLGFDDVVVIEGSREELVRLWSRIGRVLHVADVDTELRSAAQAVIGNWESGDLAGAVQGLAAALEADEPDELQRMEAIYWRHPDADTDVAVFIDGVECDGVEVYGIDPGYGYTRADWDETTEHVAGIATAGAAELWRKWREEAADSPHIDR